MNDRWLQTSLGDLYELVRSRSDPAQVAPATEYLGLEHLESGNPNPVGRGTAKEVSSSVTPFQEGDVLFGRLRPYLRKVAVAKTRGICTPEILVLRPLRERVEPFFLYLLAASDQVLNRCIRMSAGTRMPRTSASDLGSIRVMLPSLAEQRRIVDLIAAFDEAIESTDRIANDALVLEESIGAEVFENSEVSPSPLSSYCDSEGIQIGPFGSQLHVSDYVAVGVPSVMPKDMVGGRIDEVSVARVSEDKAQSLSRHRLLAGDILLPRRGDLTKRALISEDQVGWLCGTGTVRIRPRSDVNSGVLYRALATNEVNRWLLDRSVGATMPNLNTGIVEEIPVRLVVGAPLAVSAIEAVEHTAETAEQVSQYIRALRATCLNDILSGDHEIPGSYDELLTA